VFFSLNYSLNSIFFFFFFSFYVSVCWDWKLRLTLTILIIYILILWRNWFVDLIGLDRMELDFFFFDQHWLAAFIALDLMTFRPSCADSY